MISESQVDRFLSNPSEYAGYSKKKLYSFPKDELHELQFAALRRRFAHAHKTIPMLTRLADNQGISGIDQIDDVLPLLFDHATYKSYPASLMEKMNFKQLTAWLNKLTAHDLSQVDASGCRSIDEWLQTLKRETPLTVCHTSGTSGTMSFLPMAKDDYLRGMTQWLIMFFNKDGIPPTIPVNIPVIYPSFRHGASAAVAGLDCQVKLIAGSEERFYAAYPMYQSADMMRLAGLYRAAQAKGTLDSLQISPEMAARREEFEALQKNMPEHSAKFFNDMCTRLAGQRVLVFAFSNLLYMMADAGLKLGSKGIFAPDSVIITGGGGKGMVLPDDWKQTVRSFFGVERINMLYGMTEMCGSQFLGCEHGNYHPAPNIIPFMLDPETSAPLPRSGRVTGRFAFFDVLPQSHWGGFITADKVTMEWDEPCPCGWSSPYMLNDIGRISDKTSDGGEEKINCAATPEAYEDALEFLNDSF